jgi:membrane associated rhomboid family serine protease
MPHLLLNGLAFYLLAGQIRKLAGTETLHRLLALLMSGTGLGLYLLVPAMIQYGGLSAINYGLLAWLALHDRNPLLARASGKGRSRLRVLFVALPVGLCALQWWQGLSVVPGLAAGDGPAVAWQAHLIAIILAVMVGRIVAPGSKREIVVAEPPKAGTAPEGNVAIPHRTPPLSTRRLDYE